MNDAIEQIKTFWGNTLKTVSLSREQMASLPTHTSKFLSETGLPTDKILFENRRQFLSKTMPIPSLRDNLSDDDIRQVIPYFEFCWFDFPTVTFRGEDYFVIGNQGKGQICLAITTGKVYLLFHDWKLRSVNSNGTEINSILFLNTDITKCLLFLQNEIQHRQIMIVPTAEKMEQIRHGDNGRRYAELRKEMSNIFDDLESAFQTIDPRAMSEDSWWQVFLHDLRIMS